MNNEEIEKVKKFNQDQRDHEILFNKSIWNLCNSLMTAAIEHDRSKWSNKEYDTFVQSRDSLRGSATGKDEAYQKNLNSEAIQAHICDNSHHPEYWDKRNEVMPLWAIISMYFDW